MKVTSAKSDWIKESDLRLDASFHLSEGRSVRKLIANAPYEVRDLEFVTTRIFYGGRAKRNYVKDPSRGVPYMGGAGMLKSDFTSLKYISKKNTPFLKEYLLEKGWILISRSGTIGNTVYTNDNFVGKAGSDDIIRVIPNGKISSGTLYAYLTSKFGYALMTQGTFGAVIQHIEPDFLSSLPVPIFPKELQKKVEELISAAADLRYKFTSNLKLAHDLFDKSIFHERKPLTKKIGTYGSDTILNGLHRRLDATHYLNLITIEEAFKSDITTKELRDLVKHPMFTAQRGKRNYVKKGVKFLSTTDISQSNPYLINKYLSLKTIGLKTLMVKKDWILVASSGQEILGNVFLVDDTYNDCAINQHSIRVIIDEQRISPHYVYGFLSYPKVKKYLRAGIYGSAILTINEDFMERIKVPILSSETMNDISNYVQFYQQQKEEACKLEFKAISLIEQEIESWQK